MFSFNQLSQCCLWDITTLSSNTNILLIQYHQVAHPTSPHYSSDISTLSIRYHYIVHQIASACSSDIAMLHIQYHHINHPISPRFSSSINMSLIRCHHITPATTMLLISHQHIAHYIYIYI